MQTVAWSNILELGHERIDTEHRLLLRLAAEIAEITDAGGGVGMLQPRYQTFLRILTAHCAFEERLLQSLPRAVFGAQVDEYCRGHARLIDQAKSVAAGTLPQGYDSPRGFVDAYFQMMHDLLIDDAALIGALVREGRFTPVHTGQAGGQPCYAWSDLPPI
ncbi:MAG: hypothetical protein EPN20_00700 [Magnetospirillum sp.]|nr:MAG: hypothetical protein EPN20_00700 [Magnetospirillum sp.]